MNFIDPDDLRNYEDNVQYLNIGIINQDVPTKFTYLMNTIPYDKNSYNNIINTINALKDYNTDFNDQILNITFDKFEGFNTIEGNYIDLNNSEYSGNKKYFFSDIIKNDQINVKDDNNYEIL